MLERRRVTLKQVAHRAQVSRTTASYVLAGRSDMRISKEAAARVHEAAAALGYRPNLTARSLRTSVTRTIGLVSDTVATDSFAGQLISGAASAARARGKLLVIGETEGDPALEQRLLREMLDRQVDGVVYASMFTRYCPSPEVLAPVPVVLLNCLGEHPGLPAVVPDEHGGGRAAADVLLAAGHRDGIYLVGESAPPVLAGRERVSGLRSRLSEVGTDLAGTVECLWWPAPAYAAVSAFLSGSTPPPALVCLNDRIALGTYQALQDAGLRVPTDVSVVSFDGSDLASWLRPALTTVALPHFALGRAAVDLLDAPPGEGQVHRVAMPVLRRQSVAAPRGVRGDATGGGRLLVEGTGA